MVILEALELPDVMMPVVVVLSEMPYEMVLEDWRLPEDVVGAVVLLEDPVEAVALPEARSNPWKEISC